jgi:hypothetical protein
MMVVVVVMVVVMCSGGSRNTSGIRGCWRFAMGIRRGCTGCVGLLFILMTVVMVAASRDVRKFAHEPLIKAREWKGRGGGEKGKSVVI